MSTTSETSGSDSEASGYPRSLWNGLVRRISQGEVGSLPVVLGLIVIAIIFQTANKNFLTPLNLSNLLVQIAAVGTISTGVVLILLLGEIDLSVGAVSGFTAAIMAVLSVKMQMPAWIAIGSALLAGAGIGLLQGVWTAKLKVPSFVVTLAGLLGWQGTLLYILGDTGTINLNDPVILAIANTNLPVWLGWVIGIISISVIIYTQTRGRQKRIKAGVDAISMISLITRSVVMAVAVLSVVALLNVNRNPRGGTPIQGIPSAILILLGFLVLFDFLLRKTSWGKRIFAVGGSEEAARRAGINVDWIRISAFILGSTLAACGGVLAGSRLYAVNQSSGSGDVLLNAIAAAVIGGTSLFGGRGNTWSALLGALVIGSIANGMNLLAMASSIRFMVTGIVLLVAVTLDAYARTRRQVSGR